MTKTEGLLHGAKGSRNPRNVFRLERSLIPLAEISSAQYKKAPVCIRQMIAALRADPFSQGCSVGIGYNEEVGWFILGSGQGPFIIWIER